MTAVIVPGVHCIFPIKNNYKPGDHGESRGNAIWIKSFSPCAPWLVIFSWLISKIDQSYSSDK